MRRTYSPSERGRPVKKAAPANAQRLHDNVLFAGVNSKKLEALVPSLREHRFKAGDTIFDEATQGHDLFLILKGKVRIKKYTKYGIESLLALLHPRDFFGELAFIDGSARSARAEAVEDCVLMSLEASDLRALMAESSVVTTNLLKRMAYRLRTLDHTFVSELERNALAFKTEVDKLNLLVEASKTVNSTLNTDKLLGLILQAATRSINADRGTLYLVDNQTHELWSKVAHGKNLIEIRLPIGKGLAGYVAKTGETINIPEAYKDPRFNPEIDRQSGYRTHNVLTMPMRDREGSVVGVFQFLNKATGPFTLNDEQFIDALSVHASLAIENSRHAQEMVRTEQLSAVGKMASTIIHDIKTPMSTLSIYAQIIKKRTQDEEAADMADQIVRQVDRFVNMAQEILDFSRGEIALRQETVELGTILPGILDFIRRDLEKKQVNLVTELLYTGSATLDVDKMTRVFHNLATNAADAMPEGGLLTIRIDKDGNELSFQFIDTGIGMPDEIKARALEAFFTHGKKRGTGLGLSIVKKIIDDHKGRIEIQSEKGKGTSVTLIIPLG